MKSFIIITAVATLLLSNSDCKHKKDGTGKYKGRLEIKGICMNYTISVLEGGMDESKIVAEWTDETTNRIYENVFGLGSPCTFPPGIKAEDEFYFVLDSSEQKCMV
jgi:hypothetical protein